MNFPPRGMERELKKGFHSFFVQERINNYIAASQVKECSLRQKGFKCIIYNLVRARLVAYDTAPRTEVNLLFNLI